MSTPTNRPPLLLRSRGVTMLELMVVLVIIGLLGGLAVVKFNTFQRQAELRSSSQKLYQIMNWARLESEKRGDTLLVRLSGLPEISVYADQNANGTVDNGEPRILMDSLSRSVRVFTPAETPIQAEATASGGLAHGFGTCGSRTCCNKVAKLGVPSWDIPASNNSGVTVCAMNMPRLPSVIENGAAYLESTEAKVEEKWAIVMGGNISKNPSLWTSAKSPAARTDWSQKR